MKMKRVEFQMPLETWKAIKKKLWPESLTSLIRRLLNEWLKEEENEL